MSTVRIPLPGDINGTSEQLDALVRGLQAALTARSV
jgi:hypothetical protein